MNIDPHSIINAIIGGGLIGLSASMLLSLNGHVAGISAIVGTFLKPAGKELGWRFTFILGLLVGGFTCMLWNPELLRGPVDRSLTDLVFAGLLVGFGVRMGNGCTSGHGVCGLARFSKRSLVATLSFMATGFMTATALYLYRGGAV